jgi:hypothetical protein
MKIITLDGKQIDDFDSLQGIITTIKESVFPKETSQSQLKNHSSVSAANEEYLEISSSSSSSSISIKPLAGRGSLAVKKYKGNKQSKNEIQPILDRMSEYHLEGKIYSSGKGVFTKCFSKELGKLLEILTKVSESSYEGSQKRTITALQLEDALMWLRTVIQAIGGGNNDEQIAIVTMIANIESQWK